MHPVPTGRYSWFAARTIAATQGWIFRACAVLVSRFHIHSFGQEGFTDAGGFGQARLSKVLLEDIAEATGSDDERVPAFLSSTAQRWRRALKRQRPEEIAHQSAMLSALAVLQALHPAVTVFPIENNSVHAAVGDRISGLADEIANLEALPSLRRARAKNGRGLTNEEYAAAKQMHSLVREYNRTLASPQRDRAIFRAVTDVAQRSSTEEHTGMSDTPTTVFVLGEAHRASMLRLCERSLPEDILFLWITPAPLLFWLRLRRSIIIIAVVLLILILTVRKMA